MPLTITNARATLGLSCTATPMGSDVSGSFQIGSNSETFRLTSATQAYSLSAVFAGSGDVLILDLRENTTTGSTAWAAGTAQVETATAAGTITASGNATVTVTSAGMAGSPLAVSVAVLDTDTAATWAGKVRTALAANTTIAERFTVSGTTTAIVLTRKPTASYAFPSETVNIFPANDGTLNVALANGTCTGITGAATSANTTEGVATDGVKISGGDGKDQSGADVSIASFKGFKVDLIGSFMALEGSGTDSNLLNNNESFLRCSTTSQSLAINDVQTFTAGESSMIKITVIGSP